MNKVVNGVANDFEFDMPPISSYGSINIDELNKTIDRLKQIPNYDVLIKENNKMQQEIERLNNIIDELEKDLDKGFEVYICNGRKAGKSIELGYKICQKEILNKLKKLKEGKQ